ncbi:MAG TPA: Ig-like domain-containing protein [Acidobacteriaceae bacterium]|nr:Ig-like domain-containing protein [Acidobacteriaceae bacterium]
MKQCRSRRNGAAVSIIMPASLCVLTVLVIAGCKGFFIGPALTTVTLAPSTPSIAIGKTQQMTATGTYDNSSTETITDSASWASSDVATATVSSTGLVTGIASGSATISATLVGVSGSTTVNVTVASLASISITQASQSISSGATQQYTAVGILQNGTTVDLTSSVTWSSSNTTVATIDSAGLATAQSLSSTGTTNITANSGSVTSNTAVLTVNSAS